jgi:hypothetical protein
MIKIIDRIKSIYYRLLRSEAPNTFNCCKKCKKRRKNWSELNKNHNFIGYHNVWGEWISFRENNMYAKVSAMNGYITNLVKLTDEISNIIKPLCRKCITEIVNNKYSPDLNK